MLDHRVKRILVLLLVVLCLAIGAGRFKVFAFDQNTNCDTDDLQILSDCIKGFSEAYQQSVSATKPLEGELNKLNSQIKSAQNGILSAKKKAAELAKKIDQSEEDLAVQYVILSKRIATSYKRSRLNSPLLVFLSAQSAANATKDLMYRSSIEAQDNRLINEISTEIEGLEKDTAKLESDQSRLAALEKQLDEQANFFESEISKAKEYQSQVSAKIAALSARQQEIINARSGSFMVSVNDAIGDSVTSKSAFNANAPSGYFGVFSFGAYTHRNGMSQFGALGHVKRDNWSYEQLLKYYYSGIELKKVDNPQIIVNGTNTFGQTFNNEQYSLEDYLKHIYEVPASWPAEVLKAQAIAARSFAYGKSKICPGQACQEFKREENSEAWKQAVRDTEGMIMTGGPNSYQYSSTTGGWNNGKGWDTTDGNGGSDFVDKTFEHIGGSPWVYKAWYKDDFGEFGNKGSTCGRANPWLSPTEMADIVNAAIALKTPGIDSGRISPVTTSCWGGNPYSVEELRQLVSNNGGISEANSVSVSLGSGVTNTVTINGVQLSGSEFKKAFALRAPGFIRIPQKGFSFFNIERKN